MPRTSRSVAQRLAELQSAKAKKRRAPRPPEAVRTTPAVPPTPAPDTSVSVDQILDEIVPSEGGSRAASTPTLTPPSTTVARAGARKPGTLGRSIRGTTRIPVVRRRYSEYAEEYKYVWADLRRIVVVAGILIVLLIVLEFVLR
jgi:hypothetical protein